MIVPAARRRHASGPEGVTECQPELTQLTGLLRAGAIIPLADEAATAAAMGETNPTGEFRPELLPLTLQMSINLIRNTSQGIVVAEATITPADRPGR